MCWLEEGLPASLVPGRRPRTTLSPTLIYRDGAPVLACGTPGGDQQDQWQLVLLLSHLVRGLPLQEAIEAPNWHSNAVPSSFYPREAPRRTRGRGPVRRASTGCASGATGSWSDGWSLGRLSAVSRDPVPACCRPRPTPAASRVRRRPLRYRPSRVASGPAAVSSCPDLAARSGRRDGRGRLRLPGGADVGVGGVRGRLGVAGHDRGGQRLVLGPRMGARSIAVCR